MSQKYIKSQNKNSHNAKSFGKYYAKPVYDEKFVETDEIADFNHSPLQRHTLTLVKDPSPTFLHLKV